MVSGGTVLGIFNSHHSFCPGNLQRIPPFFLFQLHRAAKRLGEVSTGQGGFHFSRGAHFAFIQQKRVGEGWHDFLDVMGDKEEGGGLGLAGETV